MAIEDGYQLALTLDQAVTSVQPGHTVNLEAALKSYAGVSPIPYARPPSASSVLHLCMFCIWILSTLSRGSCLDDSRKSSLFRNNLCAHGHQPLQ